MNKETKPRIRNITTKAALKFGSEAWVMKKREEQRLEAAQMKFLRHLLGITKLDKDKNLCIRQKTAAQNIVKEINRTRKSAYNMYRGWTQTEYQNGSTEHSKGNKTEPEKVLKHVQRMDTNRIPKQEHRT